MESPPPDAYARVTNPERFSYVPVLVRAEIDRLVEEFDVEQRELRDLPADGRFATSIDPVELAPRRGLSLLAAETPFPGALIGPRNAVMNLPFCGCDACDEQPEEIHDLLRSLVEAVTGGTFTVDVGAKHVTVRMTYEGGARGGRTSLEDSPWRHLGPGLHHWPAWPHR